MGRKSKYTEKIVKAILGHLERGGTVEGASGSAGISTSTFFTWQQERLEFAEAVELAQNAAITRAETELDKAIDGGNVSAITFWLRARAGYNFTEKRDVVLKAELEHKNKPRGPDVGYKAFEAAFAAIPEEHQERFIAELDPNHPGINPEHLQKALATLPESIRAGVVGAMDIVFAASKALDDQKEPLDGAWDRFQECKYEKARDASAGGEKTLGIVTGTHTSAEADGGNDRPPVNRLKR